MYYHNELGEFIGTIKQTIREIFSANSEIEIFFRGDSEDREISKLKPSVFRNENLIKNEHYLYKEMIIHNPQEFEKEKLTISKLAIMQHYGLPTRLLDISKNLFNTLYFACNSNPDSNGTVYVIGIKKNVIRFYDSDTVSVLANLTKREKFDFPYRFSNVINPSDYEIEKFNNTPFIRLLLHNIKDEKPYFKDRIIPEHLYSIRCVKPLQNNRRLTMQDGYFLIFGNNKSDKYKPAKINPNEIVIKKVSFSAKKKEVFKKDLNMFGIYTPRIYPEMTEVSEYLEEKYKQNNL